MLGWYAGSFLNTLLLAVPIRQLLLYSFFNSSQTVGDRGPHTKNCGVAVRDPVVGSMNKVSETAINIQR
jgi:hypothetical protein